jgi:hypothetical protein
LLLRHGGLIFGELSASLKGDLIQLEKWNVISKRQQLRELVTDNPAYTVAQLATLLGQSENSIRGALSAIGVTKGKDRRRDSSNYKLLETIRDLIHANPDWSNKRLAQEANAPTQKVWEARAKYDLQLKPKEKPKCRVMPRPNYSLCASTMLPTRQTGYLRLM